jgi:hypothetical protein
MAPGFALTGKRPLPDERVPSASCSRYDRFSIMIIREVDWSTAEVSEKGTLTVVLAGESDEQWCEAFTTAAALLDAASHNHLWGEVVARSAKTGDQVIVKGLQTDDPEHVESLCEFFAAVARQASADVPEPDGAEGDGADRDSSAARSTRAFRALAEQPEP